MWGRDSKKAYAESRKLSDQIGSLRSTKTLFAAVFVWAVQQSEQTHQFIVADLSSTPTPEALMPGILDIIMELGSSTKLGAGLPYAC